MNVEAIIQQILAKCPEIQREKILERLESERKRTGGLISDESLMRMIAVELGVEVSQKIFAPTALIKDLVPNLGDVTVAGRIVAVFNPKTTKANTARKMARLLIADKSGVLRVVLWNDKADMAEGGKLKTGQIVRFLHGYTRENRDGKVELHVAEKSTIQMNPKDINAEDYPTIEKFSVKIKDLTASCINKRLNLAGVVKEFSQVSTFQRQDSTYGKLMRFVLSDGTGEISIVVWNNKVEELKENLKEGVKLRLVNAKAKKALGGGIEIHVDQETYIEKLASTVFLKVAELKESLDKVSVKGKVATKPITRTVKTSKSEIVEITTFELEDETGSILVTAWKQHAQAAAELKRGDKITIENAYVKKGFADKLEISTKNTTTITLQSET